MHQFAFWIADCLFLALIGYVAVTAMQFAENLGWAIPLTWLAGMALAMLTQVLLSFLFAPLLGSIESMVPSMIVAMFVPMLLEGAGMLGFEREPPDERYLGSVLAVLTFLMLGAYGVQCRRRFQRRYDGP